MTHPPSWFDRYVPGSSGALAVAAAQAVAEARRPPYNPLLVVGGAGSGKTHLLTAVAERARAVDPARPIVVIDAGRTEWPEGKVGIGGMLLVDGVERLADRSEEAERLRDMLERRLAEGIAVVCTADRPPSEIPGLDPPLARIAESGLVTELDLPIAEGRRQILAALEPPAPLTAEVLDALAQLPVTNVRELLGAYHRLVAFQAVSAAPLDVSQAMVLLTGVTGEAASLPTPEAAAPLPDAQPRERAGDEFGDFLSEVVAVVTGQVDRWRGKVADAILRWEGEGFRTRRLEIVLAEELPEDPERTLREFERDVEQLRALEQEAVAWNPEVAGHPDFRNPDAMEAARRRVEQARLDRVQLPAPDPALTFELFEGGGGTRDAIAAIQRVSDEPARFSPLVLSGASGTGKTHLLHAIGNELLARGVRPVACLAAADLGRDEGGGPEWVTSAAGARVLLLDDLEGLAGDRARQEELVRVLDRVRARDGVIVVTASRPLTTLEAFDPKLLSRLSAGTSAELSAPDRDQRARLIKRWLPPPAAEDPSLVDSLAARPADSVRAVQGMVRQVLGAADAHGGTATASLVREVLDRPAGPPPRPKRPGRSANGVANLSQARLREKLPEIWPNAGDRLLEEFR